METKGGLGRRMFNLGSGGVLGLEMPLQPPGPPVQSPNHHHHLQQPTAQMVGFAHHEDDHQQPQTTQLSMKRANTSMPKNNRQNQQQRLNSDEDEPGCVNDDSSADGRRKSSPWQRMKWTDNMVRLLIMVVYYIGDEVGSEGNEKKKSGGGLLQQLQKKGKWKSVSQAMLEKGFYVSPQQCEDKFNDLNKRYKRVIDIFGRGTACRVVENQRLLDSMDLSSKTKEEARKLLNSKHLFFREMCAYHNTSGHGGGSGSVGTAAASSGGSGMHQHHSPEVLMAGQPTTNPQQQQQCFHAAENPAMEESSRLVLKVEDGEYKEDGYDNDHEEEEEEDLEDDERDESDPHVTGLRKGGVEEALMPSRIMRQFSSEVLSVVGDGSKSSAEKKQWMMVRLMQIEEQGVKYRHEAFEIEKQRLKWVKFSSKKGWEMDRMKLENERQRLENERMRLLLRQKEIELFHKMD
ncbi:hypothetical protein Dimus_007067 [Dionaea muscipula]